MWLSIRPFGFRFQQISRAKKQKQKNQERNFCPGCCSSTGHRNKTFVSFVVKQKTHRGEFFQNEAETYA